MVHIFFCVSQDGPNLQQGFFQKLAFSNIFDGGFPDICNYHLEHELIFRPFDGFFERKWISGSIRIQQFIYAATCVTPYPATWRLLGEVCLNCCSSHLFTQCILGIAYV